MAEERCHVAVWSGEIMGVRVYVLDDGRRIIDANDFVRILNGELLEVIDLDTFARVFKEWMSSAPEQTRVGEEGERGI